MNHQAKKQISFWIGVFLIFLTACGVQRSPTPEPIGAGANSVVIATFTPPADQFTRAAYISAIARGEEDRSTSRFVAEECHCQFGRTTIYVYLRKKGARVL
jgi:hypothetical protein